MGLVCSCVPQPERHRSSSWEGMVSARNTALVRVSCDAELWWSCLQAEWKMDKEFILKALKESPNLPPKSDFERRFPQSLRNDRDVVLAFTKRPDFVKLVQERHLFCPDTLTGDKEVMLAYCTWIPRSLQECSNGMLLFGCGGHWQSWRLMGTLASLSCM